MCTIDKKRPTLTQPSELSILHSRWDSVSVSGMKLTLRYHNNTTHAVLQISTNFGEESSEFFEPSRLAVLRGGLQREMGNVLSKMRSNVCCRYEYVCVLFKLFSVLNESQSRVCHIYTQVTVVSVTDTATRAPRALFS